VSALAAFLVLFVVLAVLGAVIAGLGVLLKAVVTPRSAGSPPVRQAFPRWTDDDEVAARHHH